MRREEEIAISSQFIAQGSIYGTISVLTVPPVKAGAYIDIDITYYVVNPNGSFWNPWKVFIVAKDSMGKKEMVKDVTVKDDEYPAGALSGNLQRDTLRLWQMPNQAITLQIRLYAHDEVVSWNWVWWP